MVMLEVSVMGCYLMEVYESLELFGFSMVGMILIIIPTTVHTWVHPLV